jgi:hypothetical protein
MVGIWEHPPPAQLEDTTLDRIEEGGPSPATYNLTTMQKTRVIKLQGSPPLAQSNAMMEDQPILLHKDLQILAKD